MTMSRCGFFLLATLVFTVFFAPLTHAATAAPTAEATQTEYTRRTSALKVGDAAGRWQLAQWCRTQGLTAEWQQLLDAIIVIDPDHAAARKALGFEKIAGKWLAGDEAAKAKGWVKFNGTWMPPERARRMQTRQDNFRKLAKVRADWNNAWQIKSPHFTFTSNSAPRVVEEISNGMELCYRELVKVFNVTKELKPIPVEVYANQEQFMKGSAEAGFPVPRGVLGYFYYGGGEGVGIRCFYTGNIDHTLATLQHECTHLMVHTMVPDDRAPTWMNEGLAVYFEDAQRTDTGLDLKSIPFYRLWSLQEQLKEEPISLNLLTSLRGSRQYSGEYYPQGWSLVYFMLYGKDGKYRKNFMNFYDLLRTQRNQDDQVLFRQAFGGDADTFKDEWQAFVTGIEPTSIDDLINAATTAATIYLDFKRASAFAAAALTKAPNDWRAQLCNARLHLNLGLWERKADEFPKAAVFYAKAIELRSAKAKKASLNLSQVRVEFAHACIRAGDYDQASDILEAVLADDELCTGAYCALALLHTIATNPNVRDLKQAKAELAIADDLGQGHENHYVRAMIALAEQKKDAAISELKTAAGGDTLGFSGHFYRRQLMTLTGAIDVEGE